MVQKFSELPQRKVYIGNTPWETGQGVRLCLKFVLWNAGKFAKKPPVGCYEAGWAAVHEGGDKVQ